jgi:hypothetical protein
VGPRTGLHSLENKKIIFTAGIRTSYRPAHKLASVPSDLYRMYTRDTTVEENVKLCMFMYTVSDIRFHIRCDVGW